MFINLHGYVVRVSHVSAISPLPSKPACDDYHCAWSVWLQGAFEPLVFFAKYDEVVLSRNALVAAMTAVTAP